MDLTRGPLPRYEPVKICADCGKETPGPFVDTCRDNAPICSDCHQRWREQQEEREQEESDPLW